MRSLPGYLVGSLFDTLFMTLCCPDFVADACSLKVNEVEVGKQESEVCVTLRIHLPTWYLWSWNLVFMDV